MNTLPQHLQKYQAPDVGAALSQNLGSAMPPHVSIEGGRFTLVDASNNEIPVPTFDPKVGVYLDAAIIDVNEHMSRMYYIKDYDPSAAGSPPDCWSDNGVAASVGATSVPLLLPPHPRAGQPAATCAECPMAVWGSKISNLGSKIPACSQKQKMALLIPGYQTLFLLAVPPNSHKFLREYVERAKAYSINLANIVTRISFVPGVQGTLQFNPAKMLDNSLPYIDEPTTILRQAAYTEKKTDALVGRNDVPWTAALAAPANSMTGLSSLDQGAGGGYSQRATTSIAPPTQQVQQSPPFVPLAPSAPNAVTGGQNQPNAAQPAATIAPSEPAPTPRRRRRTAAEMQAAQPGQPAPAAAQTAPQSQIPQNSAPASSGQMPQAPFPHPGQAAAPQQLDAFPQGTAQSVGQPQFGMAEGQLASGNPEVSQMLDNFFKQS